MQEGYAWIGGSGNVTNAVPTSSFGSSTDLGPLNAFTASQEILNNTFATTGSNTFVGQQNIQNFLVIEEQGNPLINTQFNQDGLTGKLIIQQSGGNGVLFNNVNVQMAELTASLQEGYVWVGDSAGRTTTVATSSFGGTTDLGPLNSFTASQEILNDTFATTGSNTFDGNQTINGALYLGDGFGTPAAIYANALTDFNVSIDKDLRLAGTLTASLQEGYVWTGDSLGRTITVPTSSFGGGGTTFPYTGDAQITGSLEVSETIKSQIFINPQTISGSITIPTNNNAMLVGPISVDGSIIVEGNSKLIVLDQITGSVLPSGLLSSSVTDFTTYSASVDSRINLSLIHI